MQNILKGFRTHVGFKYLTPAGFQLAITGFAQERERLQFIQFIALLGVLGLGGGFLVLQLRPDTIHNRFRFSSDCFFEKLLLLKLDLSFIPQTFFKIFHAVFHDLLHAGNMLGADFLVGFDQHLFKSVQAENDRFANSLAHFFGQLAFNALPFGDYGFK